MTRPLLQIVIQGLLRNSGCIMRAACAAAHRAQAATNASRRCKQISRTLPGLEKLQRLVLSLASCDRLVVSWIPSLQMTQSDQENGEPEPSLKQSVPQQSMIALNVLRISEDHGHASSLLMFVIILNFHCRRTAGAHPVHPPVFFRFQLYPLHDSSIGNGLLLHAQGLKYLFSLQEHQASLICLCLIRYRGLVKADTLTVPPPWTIILFKYVQDCKCCAAPRNVHAASCWLCMASV